MIVYINGEYLPSEKASLSPLDRGFLFADAIYEVVRFWKGRAYHLEEHISRMRDGLAALRIDADPTFFYAAAPRLLAENRLGEADALVYAQISRGAAARTHVFPPSGTAPTVFAFARPTDPPPAAPTGSAILLPDERWGRCDIKSVMLLPNVLAAQRARDAGAMEAILVRDGIALEAARANLFAVIHDTLRTCPSDARILPGVTRASALAHARQLNVPVEERPILLDELFSADEVFLASTTLWTYPLSRIDGKAVSDGRPGAIAGMLRRAMWEEFTAESKVQTRTADGRSRP